MYLSRLVLNERDRLVLRDLANAHDLHRRIMQAFPDEKRENPRADWQVLFRQEPASEVVLVQSEIEPDWTYLPSTYLSDRVPNSIQVKLFELSADRVGNGSVWQFRLRANPSKRDSTTKKTVGFYHCADQLAWLERQAGRNGFRLHGVDVVPSPNVFGRKGQGMSPIRITTALYQGILEVTDSALFLVALRQGLGRGKSYGCGLVSIARLVS